MTLLRTLSIFLIFILPAAAFAFNDVINQTVVGPLLQAEKYNFTPALGINSRLNGRRSWFFQNWFVGGALGLNYDFIYLQKMFLESKQKRDTQGTVSSLFNLSFGYTWTSLKLLTVTISRAAVDPS